MTCMRFTDVVEAGIAGYEEQIRALNDQLASMSRKLADAERRAREFAIKADQLQAIVEKREWGKPWGQPSIVQSR